MIKFQNPAIQDLLTGERLSKRVMRLQNCSRREAEQYIEGGWVRVNGQVVEGPMTRITDHRVEVDAHANLMAINDVTLLLNKPPGFETMAEPTESRKWVKPAHQFILPDNRWEHDSSGVHLLKRHFAKLTACVPLESGASGLVVFTQDWRVLRKLTEDAAIIEHELVVEVVGEVAHETLHRLNAGLNTDGQPLPTVKASVNSTAEKSTRLRFAFKGAQPGLLAYLCECVGLQIISMKRQRVGRVALSNLPEGQWRYLQANERF
jgi:23S rRNA pseudouridine2604 synthase